MTERERDQDEKPQAAAEPPAPAKDDSPEALELDLEVQRIDTQGVLKEGFAGQEM